MTSVRPTSADSHAMSAAENTGPQSIMNDKTNHALDESMKRFRRPFDRLCCKYAGLTWAEGLTLQGAHSGSDGTGPAPSRPPESSLPHTSPAAPLVCWWLPVAALL